MGRWVLLTAAAPQPSLHTAPHHTLGAVTPKSNRNAPAHPTAALQTVCWDLQSFSPTSSGLPRPNLSSADRVPISHTLAFLHGASWNKKRKYLYEKKTKTEYFRRPAGRSRMKPSRRTYGSQALRGGPQPSVCILYCEPCGRCGSRLQMGFSTQLH